MIYESEVLMGRAKRSELPKELQTNLDHLLTAINCIRLAYGKPMKVTSGYRPAAANQAAGGAQSSAHLSCLAVDISDKDGKLWAWCLNNLKLMKQTGLYLEDRRWTPSWVHFQLRAPKSGKRIFVPNSFPPAAPQLWDGSYDSQWDLKV